jgi:phosphoglycerate dehydrogenase-like enzyme
MVESGGNQASRDSPDKPTVVVLCGEDRPLAMEPVEDAAEVRYADADGLADALSGADALFVWDFLSDAVEEAWHAADSLSWVHIAGAGVDKLLFRGLVTSDVTLTNSRGVFDSSIAEYVLGAVLAFAKDMPRSWELQRERRWQHRETERICGRSALVVGTGPIGAAAARALRAAGMHVSGIGRHARTDDPDFGAVHSSEELTRHLPDADVVVALAPLTEQTNGMFDARAFAAMKSSARLVNVGRGALVVTSDLVEALRQGEIAGAALDVFETEPLPEDSPLWTMPGVMISPHMSGDFLGWKTALAELFVEDFRLWLAGEQVPHVVDKRRGYVPSGR